MRSCEACIDVVGSAADEQTAIEQAARLKPHVAVVDVGTARLDGLNVMQRLRQHAPAIQIVVLSAYATFRAQALGSGACQFLLKDCSRDELVTAIQLAARGQCQSND